MSLEIALLLALTAMAVVLCLWLLTAAQRCAERQKLYSDCANRHERAIESGVMAPDGVVATYGPGLAPLEYAKLTGLLASDGQAPSAAPHCCAARESVPDGISPPNIEASAANLQSESASLQSVLTSKENSRQHFVVDSTPQTTPDHNSANTRNSNLENQENWAAPPPTADISIADVPAFRAKPRMLPELKVQKLPNVGSLVKGATLAKLASRERLQP